MFRISQDKLKILDMLEQGKITYSEAIKLLDTIEHEEQNINNKSGLNKEFDESVNQTIEEFNSKIEVISKSLLQNFDVIGRELEKKLHVDTEDFNKNIDIIKKSLDEKISKVAEDISKNADGLSSELIKKTSSLDKTDPGSEKLNKSIKELEQYFVSTPMNVPDLGLEMTKLFKGLNIGNTASKAYTSLYRRNILDASHMNLLFENINGNISLEQHDSHEIVVTITTGTNQDITDDLVYIIDNDDTYGIKVNYPTDTYISINVKVPNEKFKHTNLSTKNGKILISDLGCQNLLCTLEDGRLSTSSINCDTIEISASNSKIELSDTTCVNLFVNSPNSPLIVYNTQFLLSNIKTSNYRVDIELPDDYSENGELNVSSDNGKVDIDLPLPLETAILVDASAFGGSINLDIPDIIYVVKESSDDKNEHIICKTENYDDAKSKLKISATTIKSSISIRRLP